MVPSYCSFPCLMLHNPTPSMNLVMCAQTHTPTTTFSSSSSFSCGELESPKLYISPRNSVWLGERPETGYYLDTKAVSRWARGGERRINVEDEGKQHISPSIRRTILENKSRAWEPIKWAISKRKEIFYLFRSCDNISRCTSYTQRHVHRDFWLHYCSMNNGASHQSIPNQHM